MAKPVYALVNGAWVLVGSTTAHNHTITDITGLQAALDAKANLASPTFTGTLTADTVKITGGVPGAGKVLTSDADGDATWEAPATAGSVASWDIATSYSIGDQVIYNDTIYLCTIANTGVTPTKSTPAYNTDATANNDLFANRKWIVKGQGATWQHLYPTLTSAGVEAGETVPWGGTWDTVWYALYVTNTGTFTITTTASTGDAIRDTQIRLFQGNDVSTLTELFTSDVGGTLDQDIGLYMAEWAGMTLQAGQTYIFQISSYANRAVDLVVDVSGTASTSTPPGQWTPIVAPVVTINGSGSDDSGNITINTGHTIEDETVAQTQRSKLNFAGAGITVTDDAANDRTVVTVPGGIQQTLFDAKGDILVASAADTATRLPAGSNGQILLADSAEATGLKWVDSSVITPSYSTDLGAITGGVPVTVTHNLNTYDVVVQILEKNTAGAGGAAGVVTDATVAITSANAVDITFIDAAVANLYRVTVVAVGGTAAPTAQPGTILGVVQYNPTTSEQPSVSSSTFIDVDATNLVVTFTAPTSGSVLLRLTACCYTDNGARLLWNVRDTNGDVSGTAGIVARQSGSDQYADSGHRSLAVLVPGLTPGNSYTWKWGHAAVSGTAYTQFGGTSGITWFGPAVMEVVSAP